MMRTSTLIRLKSGMAARVQHGSSERGVAMLSAILFMIIMAGIGTVIVGIVVSQATPSNIAQKSTKTIYAAQAGMQAALGMLRTAQSPDVSNTYYGDPTKLPCGLTGDTNGTNDASSVYTVSINYYSIDPTGLTASQLAGISGAVVPCNAPNGTGTVVPKWAVLVSKGAGPSVPGVGGAATGNRSLSAVYKFQISNVNVPGGRIYNSNNTFCLQAVSASSGSTIKWVALSQCVSANDSTQLWTYDKNYELSLASTTIAGSTPLCVTGPVHASDSLPQKAQLATCITETVDGARWNQLWSWTGSYSWVGETSSTAITGPSNTCLAPGAADGSSLTGLYLMVNNGCSGTFTPSAQVGPGPAGATTNQIVNYKEFGRCLDVTNEVITSAFMISYPCKQDPTGTGVYLQWNHKWFYTEATSPAPPAAPYPQSKTQQIYVYYQNSTAQKYCFTTPTLASGSVFPTFAACSSASTQQWTRVNNSGAYSTSYLFVDTYGRCLTADSSKLFNSSYSEITVAACNGGDAQRWNAPSTSSNSDVGGFREVSG
jgi:hypothetical protein